MSGLLPDEFPFKRRPAPTPRETGGHRPSSPEISPHLPAHETPATGPEPWQLLSVVHSLSSDPQFAAQPPQPVAPPPPPQRSPAPPPPVAQRIVVEEPLVQVELAGGVVYTGPERRRSPRQNLRTKGLYKPEHVSHTGGAVHVNNISMLGVRFWTKAPIPHGDRGTFKLEVGPLRWSSNLKIVSCLAAEDEQGYVIGAEFVGNELPRGRNATAA